MKYGYISEIGTAKEFQEYIVLFEQQGVALENVIINRSFDEFIASLKEGDTAIICSYVGLFVSIGSYLTAVTELLERGILIESLLEPNMRITRSNVALIRELNTLNHQLRSRSSLKVMSRLKDEGKKVGRPRGSSSTLLKKVAQTERLCQESDISVVAACKLTGCNPKTYYRLKNGAEHAQQ